MRITRYELNGDSTQPYWRVTCNECCRTFHESHGYLHIDNLVDYCYDCGFKLGKLDEKQYLRAIGWDTSFRAGIDPETKEIIITDKKFPWEKSATDYRHDSRYKAWRLSVFERDNFTCQGCDQVGGELQAHHLKTFKDYRALRYDTNNGITLCKRCHLLLHQIKREEGKHAGKDK